MFPASGTKTILNNRCRVGVFPSTSIVLTKKFHTIMLNNLDRQSFIKLHILQRQVCHLRLRSMAEIRLSGGLRRCRKILLRPSKKPVQWVMMMQEVSRVLDPGCSVGVFARRFCRPPAFFVTVQPGPGD